MSRTADRRRSWNNLEQPTRSLAGSFPGFPKLQDAPPVAVKNPFRQAVALRRFNRSRPAAPLEEGDELTRDGNRAGLAVLAVFGAQRNSTRDGQPLPTLMAALISRGWRPATTSSRYRWSSSMSRCA